MATFKPDKTDIRAFRSDASILFLSGPVGVGKSSLVLQKIAQFVATKMLPVDGIRRARVLVVRQDLPKLETSTMAVLKEWYGDEVKFHGNYPKTAELKIHNFDKTVSIIEYVMKGFPDSPSEIYDNFSGVPANVLWINEVQTYSTPDIVEVGFQRMGRYLKREQGNQGHGLVIADYNPPSNAHWIADWYNNPPDKVSMDAPISGLEAHDVKIVSPFKVEFINWPAPFIPEHTEEGELTGYKVNPEADYFYKQPSGISYWLKILQSLSKSPNKIRTNILGEFGYRSDGVPVYDGVYNERMHVLDGAVDIDHDSVLYVGCDPSGFRGAAAFMQEDSRGLNILGGIAGDSAESISFYELLHDYIIPWLVRHDVDFDSVVFVLDPANHRNDAKMTPRDECIQAGFVAYNAPSNDIEARIEALRYFFLRSKIKISNVPDTLLIRQGLAADYYWKKAGANTLGLKPKPEKTRPFSDLIESIQYVCLYLRRGAAKEESFSARQAGQEHAYISTDVDFV
jgi:hypothetical protein